MIEDTRLGRILRLAFALAGLCICLGLPSAIAAALAVRVAGPASAAWTAVVALDAALAVTRIGLLAAAVAAGVAVLVMLVPEPALRRLVRADGR